MLGKLDAYNVEHLKVLLVDDNRHTLTIVRNLLSSMRIRNVTLAADAVEALRDLRITRPDLIIVDWHMTPLDGLEFTRHIRRGTDCDVPDIPIILLTAYTEPSLIFQARDAGVNEILAKPVSFKTLYDRLVAVINDSRPFVRLPVYIGPSRRRRRNPEKAQKVERRKEPIEVEED
jgi:CheY-like chemotaxis protein